MSMLTSTVAKSVGLGTAVGVGTSVATSTIHDSNDATVAGTIGGTIGGGGLVAYGLQKGRAVPLAEGLDGMFKFAGKVSGAGVAALAVSALGTAAVISTLKDD